MRLDRIAALARPGGPGDAPIVRLESDGDVALLIAWFGADPTRAAARIAIRGEDAGVIEREALYELVAGRTLGWGDSIGATLPGDPDWEPIELRCDAGHTVWVLSFDPADPPECPDHGATLRRP